MSQSVIWTDDHVQRLLQNPDSLLAEEPWRALIQAMGGLEACHRRLRGLPLKEKQQSILNVLTSQPGASVHTYCTLLHIHPATFHRHQRLLFQSLANILNTLEPPADPAKAQPASSWIGRARHQLPAPLPDFLGRDREAASLIAAIRGGANLAAIQGMGGVGKTELACSIARSLLDRFPDAQAVIALHGAREAPLPAVQAVQSIIRLFSDDELPGELEALLPIYRSCLYGKRILILADDARDAEQVRPLVPPEGNLLLITSRQRFTLPGMAMIELGVLPAEAARRLLKQLCWRISDADASAITAALGALPLALRTSGTILANTPALPVARYLQRLADTRQRLAALRDPDDPALNVEASLDLSYASLEPADRQPLRQLSVLATDFSAELALAVVTAPPDCEAPEEALYRLLRRNLMQYDTLRERWSLHDIVRAFGHKKAAPAELDAARQRYALAALAGVQAIHERYQLGGEDALASLADFDRDRPHLAAAWEWALEHQGAPPADQALIDAAVATQKFARLRSFAPEEHRPRLMAALEAARRLGDPAMEGEIIWYVGTVEAALGNIPTAINYYHQAIPLLTAAGQAAAVARARFALATAYVKSGGSENYTRGLEIWLESLEAFRQFGAEPQLMALCLNNIGVVYRYFGDYPTAIRYFEEASTVAEAHGEHLELGRVLHNLGFVKMRLNIAEEALPYFSKALAIAERIGARDLQGAIHGRLAEAFGQLGDARQAYGLFEKALQIFAELHERMQEAYTRWQYGVLLVRHDERERGLQLMRASLAYQREIKHGSADHDAAIIARLEAGEPWADVLSPPTPGRR